MVEILIVEDDKTIALGLEYSLQQEGFVTTLSFDATTALQSLQTKDFTLVILDVALPDGSGFEICKFIRSKGNTPIIFLTACDEEVNVVMGLDLGADDYITKPFRIKELMSRIKSVLRRYNASLDQKSKIALNGVTIFPNEGKVYKGEVEIALTSLEYKLLLTLANHQGQVLSRTQVLQNIWDLAGDFINDNTLSVHIKRLREKIEDNPHKPTIIKTVRGMGYKVGD